MNNKFVRKIPIILLILLFFISIYLTFLRFNKRVYLENNNNIQNKSLRTIDYKVSIFADSHLNFENLKKAISMSNIQGVDYIIHVGDHSDLGNKENISKTKKILDESNIPYLVLPGDRDLYNNDEEATQNEETLFYSIYGDKVCDSSINLNIIITCLVNPYNYNLISEEYLNDFIKLITSNDDPTVVIASQPIYNPKTNIYMGIHDDDVKDQANQILSAIRNSNIKVVISGDTHFFDHYKDEFKDGLEYYTLGAITDERNIQQPNFVILKIYSNSSIEVEQVLIEN